MDREKEGKSNWLESFTRKERERKATEHIEMLQEEYAEELEAEA